jgi:hypothetical protein
MKEDYTTKYERMMSSDEENYNRYRLIKRKELTETICSILIIIVVTLILIAVI